MAFLAQKLFYKINIWFGFVSGSFFEQDHLLNLIILGVYTDDLNDMYFKTKADVFQNLIDIVF